MNTDRLNELKVMTKGRSYCPYFYDLVEELVRDYENISKKTNPAEANETPV